MFYGLALPLSNCHFLFFSTKNFHLEISLVKSLSCGGGVGRGGGGERRIVPHCKSIKCKD